MNYKRYMIDVEDTQKRVMVKVEHYVRDRIGEEWITDEIYTGAYTEEQGSCQRVINGLMRSATKVHMEL